ncbi:MAG: putative lipid II flippase FtsW [Myxococcales bacterium]|nr:putative lipid II flippase FtsW [Myxococcales bacterium]
MGLTQRLGRTGSDKAASANRKAGARTSRPERGDAKNPKPRRTNARRSSFGDAPAAPRRSLRQRFAELWQRIDGERAAKWPEVTGPADAVLMGTVVALVAFGVVMVYSASAVLAYSRHDTGQYYLIRQGIFAAVGLPTMVLLARFDYHRLRGLTYVMLGGATGLLFLSAFGLGKTAGGASRWIRLGPINIQPAEIVKVAMICWLAYSLSKKREQIRSFSVGFLPHVLMAGFLMVLCLKQPDFGSAVMIALLTFVLLFTAGARLGYMLGAGMLALPIVYYLVTSSEYRMRRITAFLEPFEHRYTAGYQIAESLMSFGSGGVTGIGLGDSRQKLFFLPEAHTDFISAIVGEELGFMGFLGLVGFFLLLVVRGLRAAYRAPDDYGTYLAVGVTMFVGLQAFTNLAVAVGLLPTKGLVLPFISYGGSALLVNCAAIGILLNVSRPRRGAPMSAMRASRGKSNLRVASAGGVS